MALAPEQAGIGIRRHFTTPGVDPYDELGVGAARRPHLELEGRHRRLRAARRRVPRRLVAERHEHRRPEVLPRHPRHRRAGVVAQAGRRPRGRHHHPVGRRGRLLRSTTARPRRSTPSSSTSSSPRRRRSTRRSGSTSASPACPQQASACFILVVDDTMDSILNWYVEEGTIFKGGSGSGVNLSRIRSSARGR